MKLVLFCDGGSRGNPGPAASAFIVYEPGGKLIKAAGKYLGFSTNNKAEYEAVLLALRWVTENFPEDRNELIINIDSELLHHQLTGKYKIKNKDLKKMALKIKNFEREVKIEYKLIPRKENSAADFLVNKILDKSLSR